MDPDDTSARRREIGAIADHLPALISWVGADARYRFVNRSYVEFFGHERSEIEGRHMREVLGDETWQVIEPYIERVLRGERVEYEARLPYQYGGARDVLAAYVPNVTPDGTIDSFFVLVHDVSERKRLESQLRDAEHRIARVLESVPEGYCEISSDWRMTYINAAAERYFGKSRDQVIGLSVWEMSPRYAGSAMKEAYERAVETREPVTVEVPGVVRPDRLIELRVYPVEHGLAVFFRDITDRKLAEDRLRTSEERFRVALTGSPTLVYTTDRDLRYTWVFNPKMYTPEQLIGRTDAEIAPPAMAEKLTTFKRRVLESGVGAREILELTPETIFDCRAEPLFDGEGRTAGLTVAATDVTELFRAKAEAEAASRARDEFLATVSHELRTPMTSIVGWIGMLAHGLVTEDMMPLAIESLETSARVQQRVIDDLLDLARVATGKITLDRRRFDARAVLRSTYDAHRAEAERRDIRMDIALPPEEVELEADEYRMNQVLSNLMSNALKFTPAGGTVTLSLGRAGGTAVISVRDTGEGISPEFLPRVFDRFSQQRPGGGLGIGLSVVREIVELHGGSTSIHSEGEGLGTEIVVTLPLAMPLNLLQSPDVARLRLDS